MVGWSPPNPASGGPISGASSSQPSSTNPSTAHQNVASRGDRRFEQAEAGIVTLFYFCFCPFRVPDVHPSGCSRLVRPPIARAARRKKSATWRRSLAQTREFAMQLRAHHLQITQAGLARRLAANPTAQTRAHRTLAIAFIQLGRLDDARTQFSHVLDLATQIGDQTTSSYPLPHDAWRQALTILDDLNHPERRRGPRQACHLPGPSRSATSWGELTSAAAAGGMARCLQARPSSVSMVR